MSDPPRAAAHPILLAALGQLGGLGLVVGLLQLHAGAGWLGLFVVPEPFLMAVLAAWGLASLVASFGLVRRASQKPLWPLLVGLAPLVTGFALAAMTTTNRQMLEAGGCGLWLSLSASAERLRVVGLVGSAAIWWGCLPGLLRLPGADPAGRPAWALPTLGGLLVAAGAWALLDPLAPAVAPVGGAAVRGLWPIALGIPVAWIGTRGLSRQASGPVAERGLALAAAAWLGLLAVLLAAWLLHRADALTRLTALGPLAWPDWFAAGVSLAAAGWPLVCVAAVGSGLGGGWSGRSDGGRRGLALFLAVVVLAILALAHEGSFSDRFQSQCVGGHPPAADCAVEQRVLGACLSAAHQP